METIDIVVDGILHKASLHRSMNSDLHRTIVYYHGGGFIFGDKDDLPAYAIKHFTEAGYDVLCMEYPKAPEMTLDGICNFVDKQLEWYVHHCDALKLSKEYILFGRSAGGYLVLMLNKRMMTKPSQRPIKLIVFYGYESLNGVDFKNPSEYYLRFPHLTWLDVQSSVGERPVIKTNLLKRYPLYIYARQTGQWLNLLGIDQATKFQEEDDSIDESSEVFFAASRHDQDVSYQHTLKMNKTYKNSVIFTSNNSMHEFDQKENTETEKLYLELLKWLMI